MRILVATLIGALLVSRAPAHGQTEGLILVPFETDSSSYGTPGEVVRFIDRDLYVDLLVEDDTLPFFVGDGELVPLDPTFTPAYVLELFRACSPFCRPLGNERGQMEIYQNRLRLAQRTLELFPGHPLEPELRAALCDRLQPLDAKDAADPAIRCAEEFVSAYPAHPRADEMAWRAFSLRHRVYEFEGDVAAMQAQADAFESFLEQNPNSTSSDAVRARVARLNYMMYEMSPEGSAKDEYRRRAMSLYNYLAESGSESLRYRAAIERYNLTMNRRIYADPNAWMVGY